MMMKVTVLCDNTVFGFNNTLAEHGWSVHLETSHGNFLLDTGTGQTIIKNAAALGIDLTELNAVFLSHHHVDHTGGLADVVNKTGSIQIHSHPELFKASYSLEENDRLLYLGIPYSQSFLEANGAEFVYNIESVEVAPKVWLTGEVPRITTFEKGDSRQVVLKGNCPIQDNLLDDQSLIIESDSGLVILLGCAHAGLINILRYATEITCTNKIHAVIGGTHLGMVTPEQRKETIEEMMKFDIDLIAVSHCTGSEASIEIAKVFGNRFMACKVGSVFEF